LLLSILILVPMLSSAITTRLFFCPTSIIKCCIGAVESG
jgi:hypothetical protein